VKPPEDRGRTAEKPSEIPKQGWRDILWRTKERVKNDNLSIVSAGIAFYVFLGLIPALGALISIYGLAADPATIRDQLSSLRGALPQEVITILNDQMIRIAQQSAGATVGALFGTLLALWSGAKAIKSLMVGLNIAYHERETRGFLRLNGTALALTLAGTLGIIIAIGIIVAVPPLLSYVRLEQGAALAVSLIRWPLLGFLAFMGFAVVYRYGPERDRAKWRWVSWGAAVATIIWLGASAAFSYYTAHFAKYNQTYGSLGAVVVLLLWFVLSAYVVLLGAELNAELEHQTARDTTAGPPKPRGERNAYVADHIGTSSQSQAG
jgi:membrane protein